MAKKQTGPKLVLTEILKPDYQMPSGYDDLVKVYKKMAHDADRRLLRLEAASKMENMKVASRWAYARAMRDIEGWSGEGARRFETKPPKSLAGLQAKIEDIRTFLLAPTSTPGQIKAIARKRAASLNKTLGTDFKWDEVGKFFESSLYNKLTDPNGEKYASKTAMKVIAKIRKRSPEKIKKEIESAKEKDVRVPDDMVDTLVKDVLSKYGDEALDLVRK